jgi:hypothetical protein
MGCSAIKKNSHLYQNLNVSTNFSKLPLSYLTEIRSAILGQTDKGSKADSSIYAYLKLELQKCACWLHHICPSAC